MKTTTAGFECYRIGDLLLDVGTQEVTRDGTVLPVPRLSFNMLLSLARHAPNIVSAEQLEKEVWPGLVVDRGTINKRVLLLRKSLFEGDGDNPYIGVVRGSGYRLIVPVERLETASDDTGTQSAGDAQKNRGRSRWLRNVIYSLLGLIVVFVLYRMPGGGFTDRGDMRNDDSAPSAVSEQVSYNQNSIAVLPFVDLQDGRANQFIGDGIAEEVINLLSRMQGLSVAARTSSFSFRDSAATIEDIAARLKVGTVLEGSIRHYDDKLRVTAQLVDANTGRPIWSQHYDGELDDVFGVQDDIAFNIAQSLKLTLDEGERLDSGRQMTGNIEAFELYLEGRSLLNDRIYLRSQGLRQALDLFSEAVEKDPGFARAHAGIATTYWLLTSYDHSVDIEAYLAKAESSAKFALAIDPQSVDALGALAAVSSDRGELATAARLFDQVKVLDTSNSDIIGWDATLRIRLGYFESLINILTETHNRDPLNEHISWALSDALIFSGKPAEASAVLKDIQYFSHRDYYLGLCAIYAGEYDKARGWLRDVEMRSGVLPAEYADLVVDALQDRSTYQDSIDSLLFAVENDLLDNQVVFEALLILGSPEAFSLGLNPKKDIDNKQIHAQIWNNWAVELRRDRRFKHWVRALGYEDFWRQFGWPDRCRPTGLDDFECI